MRKWVKLKMIFKALMTEMCNYSTRIIQRSKIKLESDTQDNNFPNKNFATIQDNFIVHHT